MVAKKIRMVFVMLLLGSICSADTIVSNDTTPLPWFGSLSVSVGSSSEGSFFMDGGDTIESYYTGIGYYGSGVGTVTLDGSGTRWTSYMSFRVGLSGRGFLTITNGAFLESPYATAIGHESGSFGSVVVSGSGSKILAEENYLAVGKKGSGSLDILDGGMVEVIAFCEIATSTGSDGNVLVRDSGSTLKISDNLTVGRLGDGVLKITIGGLVSVGGTLSINPNDQIGYIEMGNGGQLALYGDGSASINAFLGLLDIDSTTEINYWNGSAWDNIANATIGNDYTLEYISSGDLTGYTMLTVTAENSDECLYEVVGDFDGDCMINFVDVAVLAQNWLINCTYPDNLTNTGCY